MRILQPQDLKPGRSIVFVEHLGCLSRPLVRRSVSSGQLVIFRRTLHNVQGTMWFQTAVAHGHLREFSCHPFQSVYEYWRSDDLAVDTVGAVYSVLKRSGKVPVSPLIELYKDGGVEAAYKKVLVSLLAEFFRTVAALKMLSQEGLAVEFWPSAAWEVVRRWMEPAASLDLPDGVKINQSINAKLVKLESSVEWLKWAGILAVLPAWILCGLRNISLSPSSPKSIQVGLQVYGRANWGFRGEASREIDWLLDGNVLHAGNVLFVIEKPATAEYKEELVLRRYRFADIGAHYGFRRVPLRIFLHEILFRGMKAWAAFLVSAFYIHGVFLEVAARGWMEYLRWTIFLEHWRPRHYVAYNHFHFEHIFRNSRLRSVNCVSWYYVHSVHGYGVLYRTTERAVGVEVIWAYLDYDREIHWGVRDKNTYRRSKGNSREYLVWGPLWSAHIVSVPSVSSLIRARLESQGADKIVAVFDTSFGASAPYCEAEAQEFYEALTVMLDHPNWASRLLVFKPKKRRDQFLSQAYPSPETEASLSRLLAHPRCLHIETNVAPGAVIAEANLIISIAFTSTTVEALGARRRAFYFDPTGKFPDSYYDSFPKLVAHSREELVQLCEHWLHMPEADFQKYLDHYIAPEFGGHLDAGAVARFRAAVSTEEPEGGTVPLR